MGSGSAFDTMVAIKGIVDVALGLASAYPGSEEVAVFVASSLKAIERLAAGVVRTGVREDEGVERA